MSLFRDLRYALRRLGRQPGFTAIALVSLAVGIGANTAIFSLVNAVFLRELPLEDPDQLVEIYMRQEGFPTAPLSYPDFEDVRDATSEVFSGVLGAGYTLVQVESQGGLEMVPTELVSASYFSVLGVSPHLGRDFTQEDEASLAPVVMLDYAYWQRSRGGDPGIVGREVRLGGQPYTVIGIVADSYTGNVRGLRPAFYAPIALDRQFNPTGNSDRLEARGSHWLFSKGRLRPGVSQAQAEGVLAALVESFHEQELVSWQGDDGFSLVPTRDVVMNPILDRYVVSAAGLLMAVVGLVLLIACANLASFLLARATDRKKEVAVRLALGASRRSLIAQLLTETTLLALAGGVLGVVVAVGLLRWFTATDLPLPIPISFDLSLDATVLLFSLGMSLLAGIVFGLVPALQSSNPDVAPTLKDEGTGGGRPRRFTLRKVLVAGQVAVSTLLLLSAGLFLRSLMASQSVDVGFGQRPTGLLSVLLPSTDYPEEEAQVFVRRLLDEMSVLPGVESVGLIDNLHLNPLNSQGAGINVDGVEPPEGRTAHRVDIARIDGDFFEASGVQLLSGREFGEQDHADAAPVAIISEALAARFFAGQDPVGKMLRNDEADLEIVGVASDTKVYTLGEAPVPFLYVPNEQDFSVFVTLMATGGLSEEELSMLMLESAQKLDPDLRVFESKTMSRHLGAILLPARAGAAVVGAFATIALLLACIGLYGVVSYAVAQRSREVGIRMSLGASPWSVVAMLMRSGLSLVVIGGLAGLLLAAVAARVLSGLLFGVSATDPLTFIGVPVLLLLVAVLATFVPALRASKVAPVSALRSS